MWKALMTAVPATGASRVRLHHLHTRADGSEWVVGRVETGDFVAVPEIAVGALRLLADGLTIDETRRRLRAESGRDVDVAGFVAGLLDLGFIAAVDDRPVTGRPLPNATLPWLRPAHVRWVLSWPLAAGLAVLTAAAAVVLLRVPAALPTHHDLLWSPRGSVVLAGNAVTAWAVILLHELAHLVTARAAGLPGRMSLSTRLQFLAAQTDVSGVWAMPRRVRLAVYLSGMAVNVAVAAAAVLARAATGPESLAGRLSAAVAAVSLLCIVPQLLVFMRTDVYFLLQDLSGCRNLYADGSAYLLWWGRRLRRWLDGRAGRPTDPGGGLSVREGRAVRLYAVLLLVGTAACVGVALTVTLPVAVTLLTAAGDGLLTGRSVAVRVDGLVTVAVVGGFWALWCRAWWRRHGKRVGAWYRRHRGRPEDPTTPPEPEGRCATWRSS
jgi:putative peptide zinc metalloprotease protein